MAQKSNDKRLILRQLIEIEIQLGYDISDLIGRPLSYFDWDGVAQLLEERMKEYKENEGVDYGS